MNRLLSTCLLVAGVCTPALADDPFTLDSTTVSGGATVTITFAAPLDEAQARHWVCIVKPTDADSTFGVWAYADAGATSATLKAPDVDGDYEVRLHSNYPDKSHNVLHRVALKVTGLKPTPAADAQLVLPSASVPVDQAVKVRFKVPLVPEADDKYWACIVPAGAPATAQGLWRMVPVAAEELELPAATSSGKHEVRLHANYPAKHTNVIHSLPIEITGAEDTLPSEPSATAPSLAAAEVPFGTAPKVVFAIPVRPVTGERFWVGLAHADLPTSSNGLWKAVTPGATSVELALPLCTGKHRVTVYGPNNKAYATLELDVAGEHPATDPASIALSLASAKIAVGAKPMVKLGAPVYARTGERYWITVIPKDAEDSEWGQYAYLPNAASELELPAPEKAGSYEVRVHANHPTKSSNVVQRTDLTVE